MGQTKGLRKFTRNWRSKLPSRYRCEVTAAFLVIFALLMLPLYYISRYDVPSADDFSLSQNILTLMKESSNPIHWIRGLFESAYQSYCTAQGTFGAFLVSRLLPTNCANHSYMLVPLVLLTVFTLGVYWLLKNVLNAFFGMPKSSVIMLSTIVVTASIQMMPDAAEGFYWRSGALLYTGFHALAMLTLAYLFRIMKTKFRLKQTGHVVVSCLLFFLVGGGNYPTAMATTVVMGFVFLYVLLERRDRLPVVVPTLFFSALGLLFNVLAPGNFARMEREEVSYQGTLEATIRISFRLGFQFAKEWFVPALVLALVVALPILFDGLRESRRKFRWPLAFAFFTVCAYCSTYAPAAYSYGWTGPARYMNINYFSFVLLLFANEAYCVGWLCAKMREALPDREKRDGLYHAFTARIKRYTAGVFVAGFAAVLVLLSLNFYFDSNTPLEREQYTTEMAVKSLRSGAARQYYYEYRVRLLILQDDSITDHVLEPYSCKPEILYFDDITEDPSDWRNAMLAKYFGKNSVVLNAPET